MVGGQAFADAGITPSLPGFGQGIGAEFGDVTALVQFPSALGTRFRGILIGHPLILHADPGVNKVMTRPAKRPAG
ncbi:hypothetical protein Snoj_17090 [Streptomyces nojiriensis]|uniref:Uncharacterized protein n=1 Tax=Streptomyces nojiriensis TaxID=66374 RepID=A0ABQ3SI31_9ACTN|nr:hypothetical protein GCM10010205_80430 [Streptomyces nojiriensis]GHI67791.1 hypothetical protein Snoj_17090 [Streptomyces nojiriensis]